MKEIWKPIPGYEKFYEVSNHGRIKTLGREVVRKNGAPMSFPAKIMKQQTKPSGYKTVMLYKNGTGVRFHVHRLVARVFVPNPENKPEVNHLDGNKENNYATNFEWTTRSKNAKHAFDSGLNSNPVLVGAENGNSKLTPKDVQFILNKKGEIYQKDLAKKFGVNVSTIERIHRGVSWSHLSK